MKILLLSVLAALLAAAPADAALDFTLQHKEIAADGIEVDGAYITDGPSKIFLRILPTWKAFNTAQSLDCIPDTANSKVRLENFAGSKLLTIDQTGGLELQQLATAQLPGDAKKVVALPIELNPLPLYGWKTLEATFRYEYFGQPVRRSVLYVSMIPGRVVELTVTAPDADFDKVHKQARQLLGSWFEPSRDLPPDLQRKYLAPDAMRQVGGCFNRHAIQSDLSNLIIKLQL